MPIRSAIAPYYDRFEEDRWPLLKPRAEPYTLDEIIKIMGLPPMFSLPYFLMPSPEKTFQPPRYCYGWPIPHDWIRVWAEADERLMEWKQIKKEKKRDAAISEDEPEEEWDPDDDYVNYYVCVPDESLIRVNVVRHWAERANVQLPLYDAPIVKVMAYGKAHHLFALYDNYTLGSGLRAEQVDAIRDVWTVNKTIDADPKWYPVLPVDGEQFQWTAIS